MKVRYWIYFIAGFLVFWLILSCLINNIYILPSPFMVIEIMIKLLFTTSFYSSVFMSVFRAVLSVIVSFIVAVLVAIISLRNHFISSLLEKTILILRSIPNVTYVILLLFWVSRETMVFIVSFLLLFPIIYQNIFESLKEQENLWHDVLMIYPQSMYVTVTRIYIPLMKSAVVSSLISASSLAFKVGVMAEILGQVQTGIGRQIQLARLDIDLASVMAWTIWLILIVFVFDALIKKLLHLITR